MIARYGQQRLSRSVVERPFTGQNLPNINFLRADIA
jgi:hypothetical protein